MPQQRRKKDKRPAKQPVTMSISVGLLREVDQFAKRVERPRSQVIEMACRKFLAEQGADSVGMAA